MKNKIYNYYKNQSCIGFKLYKDDELEQIECIEDEDGVIRKRFIIKGMEDGPIVEEPKEIAEPPRSNVIGGWYVSQPTTWTTTTTGANYIGATTATTIYSPVWYKY